MIMKKYTVNDNFIEHVLNGEKYLIKTEDSDVKYPKLYILNDVSYDIYKFIQKNKSCTAEDVLAYLKAEYCEDIDKIKLSDIEECVLTFKNAGIVSENEC